MELRIILNQLYDQEQTTVLKYFIENIEEQWTEENFKSKKKVPYLDIFVTSKCNQNCSYCYLQKNKDLYPETLQDNKIILRNIDLYFNYLLNKKTCFLKRLDLFSGEIWGWPLGNKVLDIVLKYLDKGFTITEIIIPSNCSFCIDDNLLKVIDYYIVEFRKRGTHLIFSISMDGLIIDKESRPFISKEKTEEYYDTIFKFARKYDFGFHPMISPDTIHLQKENYDQWISKMNEHFPNSYEKDFGRIMQLEIRESGWTTDKILKYIEWLNHVYEQDKKFYFNNSDELILKYLLREPMLKFNKFVFKEVYLPYKFVIDECPNLGCGLGNSIQLRAGDLALIPCHRTSYDKFIFGYYILSEDKTQIIDLKAKNIPLLNAIYKTGFKTKPYCNDCFLKYYCPQYCLGANYENYDDIFYPVTENCNLQKAKFAYICLRYIKSGIENIEVEYSGQRKQAIIDSIHYLLKQEEIQQWIKRIQKIL